MKKSWIPKREFFQRLKAGTLPPALQEKYSKKSKTKSVRRVSRKKKKSRGHTLKLKTKNSKIPKNFTIYKNGEPVGEQIAAKSAYQAQKIAERKFGSKNILVTSE